MLVYDLAPEIEAATLALVRFDAHLACVAPNLRDGLSLRRDLAEVQALTGLSGGLTSLEDLVLHEVGMDLRTPSHDLVRAQGMLERRRRLGARDPGSVLSSASLRALLLRPAGASITGSPDGTVSMQAPWKGDDDANEDLDGDEDVFAGLDIADREGAAGPRGLDLTAIDALLQRTRRSLDTWNNLSSDTGRRQLRLSDPDYSAAARLEAWLGVLMAGQGVPAVLAAALALDAWLSLEPSEHQGDLGYTLAAVILKVRGLALNHLPALAAGLRHGKFRWGPHMTLSSRLRGLCAAITQASQLGTAELQRLMLADAALRRRCEGKSRTARLPALADLFISLPLVTVSLAAQRLKVSPQAIEAMLKELGPTLPRELTGRKRYRAWGIV